VVGLTVGDIVGDIVGALVHNPHVNLHDSKPVVKQLPEALIESQKLIRSKHSVHTVSDVGVAALTNCCTSGTQGVMVLHTVFTFGSPSF